jgi:methionine synthase I (cobalamin-dependent)
MEQCRTIRDEVPSVPSVISGCIGVLGGCCGTDHRHVAAIAQRCVSI